MRTVTLALLAGFTLGVTAPAQAADLDYGVLRGPDYEPEVAVIDWNGIYFGGHGGYSSASANFKDAYKPLIANALRASVAESEFGASTLLASRGSSTEGASYGAFMGFNYQFDETVVGIEADYTHFDRAISTSDGITRFKTDSLGYLHTVSLAGSASQRVEDYGTIRARGGYAIGNFLPYVTGGLAIGRVQSNQTVSIADYGYDVATYRSNQALTSGTAVAVKNFGYANGGFDQNNPEAGTPARTVIQNNKIKTMGGFTLGAGLEFAVTQNIILRGEYQYVMLNDFQKSSGGGIAINTVRGGAAVKF
ncbi:outer membrane protein [Methylobacterium sp. J-068]|uniref:outer membrane protein n=1 Tax=Methylobacterium sp. J-068 TaxID=2836649 RepID=UPI001FBAB21C|nr:outer membrane beta-barrel protein [Methylobacterium sp. J-068]MCJ2033626.1 outer membrane beta-barrel protein [Methylobacterium sp. J-068]